MQEQFVAFCRAGTMSFKYDERISPILKRFGLDRVAQLCKVRIDRDLISAAIERWRRETHSFHMPVGEISITLEDVSGLWGLPINGEPVTGLTDDNWHELNHSTFVPSFVRCIASNNGRIKLYACLQPPNI